MRVSITNHLVRKTISIVITIGCVFASFGCSGGTGFQGGNIPVDFTGISSATAISPQTFKLTWDQYPGANKYNVYSPDANTAIANPSFNTYLFKPVPLDPLKNYQYSVSAQDPISGLEVGDRSAYSAVQLLPHFNFKQSGHIAAASKNSLLVTWDAYPSVNYKVYLAERLPTGTENFNSFVATSIPAVTGVGSAVIPGLLEGHEYCAIVVASYLDSTNDSPNGTLFTGDIGTTLSTPAYMVGISGTFRDSVIGQSQKCVRTSSDFSVANLKIYAPKATFTTKPTFFVQVPGDATSDNIGNVLTEIYQVNQTTGFATLTGSTTGTGAITAQTAVPTGRYQYFAVATDQSTTIHAQAIVEIIVGPTATTPVSDQFRQWVYIRAFNTSENPVSPVGYFPEKQQGGLGAQRAGSSVVIGDFNCDGKKDMAIGIPNASLMANDNRPAQQGKVVIYYDVNTGTPTVGSRVQEITFDITSFAGEPGRNLRLGTKLYVGNFNNDNQQTNQFGDNTTNTLFQCDDLVIASGYGPMFVLYGKRDVNLSPPDGGLNFINSTSYSRNPSSSCDPSSNVCQPTVYTANSLTTQIGLAMTSGDYNGDGYEDFAATSASGSAPWGFSPGGTWVFRGSEYGLIAPLSFADGTDNISTTPGPYTSFPFIPVVAASHVFNATQEPNIPGAAALPGSNWGDYDFGISATTFHNAYYDINPGNLLQGTKRVRDILMIGNPRNNVAHACIPKSNFTMGSSFLTDANTGIYWDCSTSTLVGPAGSSSFGYAMSDIKNALRYRPNQFADTGCASGDGNCNIVTAGMPTSTKMGYPGAIAVSSLGTGKVYVFYGVNNPTNPGVPNRDNLGVDRNTYIKKLFLKQDITGAALAVTTNNACFMNGGGNEACNIQQLQHPTSSLGNFGQVVNTLPGNVVPDSGQAKDSTIAVAAPNKNFTASGGYTYFNVGSVQLFKQNSTFENNPFIVRGNNTCTQAMVCRYSDGFSNSLTSSLDYDGPNANNVYFGLGGVAGGPLQPSADNSDYNTNSDYLIGAPGYVVQTTVAGHPVSVIDNGGVFAFFSHGGTYRSFTVNESGPAASPWHVLYKSFAQESDFKFHQAISVGDLNQDGIGDVAVRINRGYANQIRIYNGSTGKVGVDTSAGGYTNFQVQGDTSGGMRFIPAGKIGRGQFPLFFVTGQTKSYLFSSGIGGLIGGVPTAFGVGGTPRALFSPGAGYLDFSDGFFYNPEVVGNIDTTLAGMTGFAHGDFNGDGYEDFAMAMNASIGINDTTATKGCDSIPGGPVDNICGLGGLTNIGSGRILVFYGGADNGFQTQPDVNGGFPLNQNYFTDYSADVAIAAGNQSGSTMSYGAPYFGAPCLAADGSGCRIQMIHENNTNLLGATLASVPVGNCINNGNVIPVSALVARLTRSVGTVSDVYIYKPKCLGSVTPDFSGLVSYLGDRKLDVPASSNTSTTLGLAMTAVTGMMGTASPMISHLVITDQANNRVLIHPVHTFNTITGSSFEGVTFGGGATFLADGGRQVNYSATTMVSGASGASIGFGNGISAAGDLNGDGFSDVVIAMTSLPRRDINAQTLSEGAFLLIFGGAAGAQTHTDNTFANAIDPSRNASCYIAPVLNQITSICNPSLVYIPQSTNSLRDGAYERSFISPNAQINNGSINEGLGSILLGVPGRDTLEADPNQRVLQGGAFYELQ